MAGALVPLIMIPRFSTYSGEGEFTTAPLDVSAYSKAIVQFWRGPLVGTVAGGTPAFSAQFQVSQVGYDDPLEATWVDVGSAITTPDATTTLELDLKYRWLRVKIELTESTSDKLVMITCWAIGSLVQRLE